MATPPVFFVERPDGAIEIWGVFGPERRYIQMFVWGRNHVRS